MYFQNDPAAPLDFQHYACLFSVGALARPHFGGRDWTIEAGVAAWRAARYLGYITGDLNGDGDYDDPGEDEIVPAKLQQIFDLFGIPLRVVDQASLGLPMGPDNNGIMRILPTPEPLDPARFWVAEAWRHKITHFVKGDGTGRRETVERDSISGGSLTVRNGKCISLRVMLVDL
jgi:hypothetical protein